MAFWEKLDEWLAERDTQLRALLENLDLLEADLFRIEKQGVQISYCIDFTDLYKYLSLSGEEITPGLVDPHEAGIEYGRMLMFNRMLTPLVLLPPYYREFRDFVARKFWSKREADYQKEAWIGDLVQELNEVRNSTSDLASFLGAEADTDLQLDNLDQVTVGRLADQVIGGLRNALDRMETLKLAGGFLSRFSSLVDRQRLVGIRDVIEGGVRTEVPRGPVFFAARKRFGELKPSKSKRTSNLRDAKAIALIVSLNHRFASARRIFVLVSSARAMQVVIQYVNDLKQGEIGGPIELRTLDFWWLWFGVAGGGAQVSNPTYEEVLAFKDRLRSELEEWARANDRFRLALRGAGVPDARLQEEVEKYLRDSASFLEEVRKPLFGIDWKLAVLDNVLTPLKNASAAVGSAVERIKSLLDRLGRVDSAEDLKQVVVEVLRTLEELIGHLEDLPRDRAIKEWV